MANGIHNIHSGPEIREIRDGLFVVETTVEDFEVRGVVLVGDEEAIVWDTLAHPDHMEPLRELLGQRHITVVYSHADWDHVWGTAGLVDGHAGAGPEGPILEVVAHETTAARFASDVPETLANKQGAEPGSWNAVRLLAPTRTFGSSLALPIGDITLNLHHLPGHTADSIVGEIPEWNILLAGDVVETPLPVVNDAAAVAGWIESLQSWAEVVDGWADATSECVVPSHGPLGDATLLRQSAGYLRGLLAGDTTPPAGRLHPFYRETHRANVDLVRRLR